MTKYEKRTAFRTMVLSFSIGACLSWAVYNYGTGLLDGVWLSALMLICFGATTWQILDDKVSTYIWRNLNG